MESIKIVVGTYLAIDRHSLLSHHLRTYLGK